MSVGAIGAGLLPIAVGYLIAHYLTYLLINGQYVIVAVSDPLQQGWDLFGTAFFIPTYDWLPPGLVWTAQLAAVVGRPHDRRVGRARDGPARHGVARRRGRRATCAIARSPGRPTARRATCGCARSRSPS